MASSRAPGQHLAIQARFKDAQDKSSSRQAQSWMQADSAMARGKSMKMKKAVVLRKQDDEEEEAMVEAAGMVGASDVRAMASAGMEGLALAAAPAPAPAAEGGVGANSMQTVLKQLRHEPRDEAECSAKFMLYENYATEVEQMRGTLLKFHEETKPTVPPVIAADMDKQVKGIDSAEAMGIYDEAREWFVFQMMRQAEQNNLKMAGILDGFEKKLEFLTSNDQSECPVCLESFTAEGAHAAETLGCCHKVCKDCWETWTSVTSGRPFCPLCRHDEFLGAVAARVSGAPMPAMAESDSDADVESDF